MSSAREVADLYARRDARLSGALGRGMRRALIAVDIEHSKNLSGSGAGAAGAYPVPIRKGHLSRSRGSKMVGETSGFVFNRAEYAHAIHNGKAPQYGGRPFLADAVEQANPTQYVIAALRSAVFA